MSSGTDKDWAVYARRMATVQGLVLNGNREVADVSAILQGIIDAPTQKFTLLVDLGIITVPEGDPATYLARFRAKHQDGEKKAFAYYNDAITDGNFATPSHILKPGQRLSVRIFGHRVRGITTTSEERMDFLRAQKAVFPGAQGAALVFNKKRDQLPKGMWHASYDEEKHLPLVGGDRWVPRVDAFSGGGFGFGLGLFGGPWDDDGAFFCFCDVPLGT